MKRIVVNFAFLWIVATLFAATPVKVACVGNSVTFGAGIENPREKYPVQLQVMLGEGYKVENFDRSGGLNLAPVFSSRMVLQRDQPIRLWGTADRDDIITVNLDGQSVSVQAGHDGYWEVAFPPMQAGGPYTIAIENDKQRIHLTDILIGDIWLCSGQSNMEFKLKYAATAKEDIPAANLPEIRLLNMQPVDYTDNKAWSRETLHRVNRLDYFMATEWQHCTPESAEDFSAVAYHFGRAVQLETGIPVGLILNAVGGSPAEAWIDRYTLEHHPRLLYMFSDWNNNDYINGWCRERAAKNIEQAENPMQRHPYHPAYLYEAGIDEITRLPIAGVIWYQGESNEQNVELHEVLFPTLVKNWREAWKIDLPFYYVQLSSMAVGRETWGHFRDSQRRLLSMVPNSGMAVSSDLGDSTDVHPREKKQVGERLARLALHHTYGMKSIVPSGPLFRKACFKEDTAFVSFDYAEGLSPSDRGPLRGFELAEHPGLFYPATGEITGEGVRVYSTEVKNPRFVRYGWSSYSDGNLINGEGLPASTFSTEFNRAPAPITESQ